jgi:hypothetical protein
MPKDNQVKIWKMFRRTLCLNQKYRRLVKRTKAFYEARGFHRDNVEDLALLGCYTVQLSYWSLTIESSVMLSPCRLRKRTVPIIHNIQAPGSFETSGNYNPAAHRKHPQPPQYSTKEINSKDYNLTQLIRRFACLNLRKSKCSKKQIGNK